MSYQIVEITKQYNKKICDIIKSVGAEYGAVGEGYGPSDAEVNAMSEHYNSQTKSHYLVAIVNGEVVGGCGIAAFAGSTETCELKKLFLLPQCRGLGVGKALSQACLEFAAQQGYQQCYLDTLSNMQAAITLYKTLGFEHLVKPLCGTVHSACDVWMLKKL